MYQVSRAIYRELSRDVVGGRTAHEHVLRACESTVERLVADRHYFARPARWLFQEVRPYVAFPAQGRAWLVVERYLGCAEQLLAELPAHRRRRQRQPAAVPGDDPPRHAVPAAAPAHERLLPVAPAPGGHGGPRPGRPAARRLAAHSAVPSRRPRAARAAPAARVRATTPSVAHRPAADAVRRRRTAVQRKLQPFRQVLRRKVRKTAQRPPRARGQPYHPVHGRRALPPGPGAGGHRGRLPRPPWWCRSPAPVHPLVGAVHPVRRHRPRPRRGRDGSLLAVPHEGPRDRRRPRRPGAHEGRQRLPAARRGRRPARRGARHADPRRPPHRAAAPPREPRASRAATSPTAASSATRCSASFALEDLLTEHLHQRRHLRPARHRHRGRAPAVPSRPPHRPRLAPARPSGAAVARAARRSWTKVGIPMGFVPAPWRTRDDL